MGSFDTVRVACPECGHMEFFQSKGGPCELKEYGLETVPSDVLSNVNRHSPQQCEECGIWFAVDEAARRAIRTGPRPDDFSYTNDWYRRHANKEVEKD